MIPSQMNDTYAMGITIQSQTLAFRYCAGNNMYMMIFLNYLSDHTVSLFQMNSDPLTVVFLNVVDLRLF